ncbi:3-oxoacyl-[acyl-carrier-protein] synthase III C-terminal domain-containing protein [Lentzea sp. NPDC051208]|uniref:type III polyketide synthase n=1 Tax=Lentzea sp. NPDC051208 TaxID=3154642 RepID=UPI003427B30C
MIEGRHFGLPLDDVFDPPGPGTAMTRATTEATELVVPLLRTLLEDVGLDPAAIAQVASATYLSSMPSLESRVLFRVPFAATTRRLPMFGQGCMAGAAALARTHDYLEGHPEDASVLFTVELSSIFWYGALQRDLSELDKQLGDNPSAYSDMVSNILTAALFSDGAAAAVMVGDEHPLADDGRPHPKVLATRSVQVPDSERLMGLDYVDTGLRCVLRPEVPAMIKAALPDAVEGFLAQQGLCIDDIGLWIVHPGGPKVLDAIQSFCGLSQSDLQLSYEVLADVGNISSATVLVMLDRVLAAPPPPAGTYGFLMAMGPGFATESVLLQW